MDILAGGDASVAPFLVPVAADAEGAVGGGAAASADAVGVAVEDVRGEVGFDGPFAEGGFEGDEGGEDLVFGYGGH